MAVSGVKGALAAAVERRKKRIFQEAHQKIEEIRKQTEQKRNQIIQQRLKQLESEMQIERARQLGEAHRLTREKILGAKHRVLQEVEQRVRAKLENLSPSEKESLLLQWLEETLQYFQEPGTTLIVRVDPHYRPLVEKTLKQRDQTFQFVEEPVGLGVVVEDPQRGFVVYNTLEERLEKAREEFMESLENLQEPSDG